MKMSDKYMRFLFLILSFLLTSSIIPANGAVMVDSLAQNASAIVRNHSAVFNQDGPNSGVYDVYKEITILNSKGDNFGHFVFWGDRFHDLKDFSGVIKDAYGKVIKKIKKSDLTTSTQSDISTIASDSYYIYYECKSPKYPYTVEYTYQEKFKDGIIAYPSFMPAPNFDVSVEKAEYTLRLPSDVDLRYKSNYDSNIKNEKQGDKNIYTVSISNMKAIPKEAWAPSFRETLPRVLFAPVKFCYDSQCGDMSTWKDYGLWVEKLLSGRDILDPALVAKLQEMTTNAANDREKVKIVYEYMQQNSRYVSIQLGIGGFQPIEATKVAKNNFGDCKGLSNWMKAMLKAVGISSNYCEISTREQILYPDFANVSQTNHAILLVPLQNDSIWLECTSQTLPFGYIHDGIAGHDALVIAEDGSGGVIRRLPNYSDDQNKEETKLSIQVKEDGTAKGNAVFVEHLHGYGDNYLAFRSNDRRKHVDYINAHLKFPNIRFNEISTSEQQSVVPWCRLEVDFDAADFASKTGSRLFIPLCPLNKGGLSMFSSEKREWDIEVQNGYCESDTIEFALPESYVLESFPKDINLESSIGKFKAETKQLENRLIYTQYIEINTGRYNKDDYASIKEFFSQISVAQKRRLVLKHE